MWRKSWSARSVARDVGHHHRPTRGRVDEIRARAEAREQQIVGVPGAKLESDTAKILIALDGTEAGDKAFKYLLENKLLKTDSHVFLCTVLPANVISTPWVAGPLTIDTERHNEL